MRIDCKKDEILLINSMLTFYHLAVTELTTKGEKVLIFTPTYYRFVYTVENEGREVIEYELKTSLDSEGET